MSCSDGSDNGNGERGVEHQVVDTLVLTYDRAADHMDIGGKCNSLDLMLDMLSRATRVLEARWRAEQVQAMLQQRASAAATQQILEDIRKGGR